MTAGPLAPAPEGPRRTALVLSYHLYRQRRRGGMHWVCDALRRAGWDVRFVTCDFSWVTRLKGDRRTEFGEIIGVNDLVRLEDDLSVGVVSTPLHPLGRANGLVMKLANLVTSTYPWPCGGVVERFARGAELVVVESCGGLSMLDHVRRATDAPIVYRVSDNLRVIRPVPSLLAAEDRAVRSAAAVSLASDHLARLYVGRGRVQLDPMGLETEMFDAATVSPYADDGRTKVVISGSSSLDLASLEIAARAFPGWDFIQFGSAKGLPDLPNIKYMGERPFAELVPWVKFADIGFAPYLARPGFEYQAEHSNRLLQYVYCRLPSVVPAALCSDAKPHFLGYEAGDAPSIIRAFEAARDFDRARVPAETVLTWDALAARLSSVADKGVAAGAAA